MYKELPPLSVLALLVANAFIAVGCEKSEYAAVSCLPGSGMGDELSCGSSDGDKAGPADDPGEPGQTQYEFKGGATGRAIGSSYWVGADVCFDINKNGICDSGIEPVEKSYAQGQYSFTPEATSLGIAANALVLATNASGNGEVYALRAPTPQLGIDQDHNVTVYTTLVVSETLFNPHTLNSVDLARSSLSNGSLIFGNAGLLSGEDYLLVSEPDTGNQVAAIQQSMASAQSLDISKHAKSVAAVVDAMYQQASYQVEVTVDAVDQQSLFGVMINGSLSPNSLSWSTDHDDESSVAIDTAQNIAIVGSQYHNRLIVIDLNNANPEVLSLNEFASLDVERDEIDAVTGASEQSLTEVSITPDSLEVVVAVSKYKDSSAGRGVGVYKANLSDPNRISYRKFGTDTEATSDFFPFPELNDMSLSSDGSTIGLAGEDKTVVVLNTLDLTEKRIFELGAKARAITLNSTGDIAYVSVFGSRTGLVVLDISSGEELSFIATGSDYPNALEVFDQDSKIAWYLRKGKVLSVYDSTDTSQLALISQIESTEKIKYFDFSPSGEFVSIGLVGGRLELHTDLNAPVLVDAFQTEVDESLAEGSKPINGLVFDRDDRLLVSIKNSVQVLDITTSEATDLSDEDLQAWFDGHRKIL